MLKIEKATRKATPALIALWGSSGSGKTYSALRIARGLVGDNGKIGIIDTENRRAEFYADLVDGWDHGDFQPPFSPDRYVQALQSFHDAGDYDCIIVDSMSHVWEGEGGVLDQADSNGKKGILKWQAPKMAYKRMLNNLLRSPTHVIFCLRAKDGVEQKGSGQNMTIESLGLTPICEKNFIYEMTVSILIGPDHFPMHEDHGRFKCNPIIPRIKAPSEIWSAIKPGEHLSEETGQKIASWISGGAAYDTDRVQLERVARDIATMGTDRLREHWETLSAAERKTLLPIMDDLKAIASESDQSDGEDDLSFDGPEDGADALDDTDALDDAPPSNGKDAKPDSQPDI